MRCCGPCGRRAAHIGGRDRATPAADSADGMRGRSRGALWRDRGNARSLSTKPDCPSSRQRFDPGADRRRPGCRQPLHARQVFSRREQQEPDLDAFRIGLYRSEVGPRLIGLAQR